MNDTAQNALAQEWVTLQNNHEQYERSALPIKLLSILLFAAGVAWPHGTSLRGDTFFGILCFIVCMLWGQESILRTSQARLSKRLLRIEALLRTPPAESMPSNIALQLHSEWLASRAGAFGLLGEYASHALRPTIAFPYAVLAAALLLLALCH